MVEGIEEVEDINKLSQIREVFRSHGLSHLFSKHVPNFDISIAKSSCLESNYKYFVWSFRMMNLLQK
jgi:hypothetical protein